MTFEEIRNKGLLLLECISGSKAYGLDTPSSDTDIKGVFYLPKDHFYGLNYIEQVSNETNDIQYYELGRFIQLLTKSNPNILELLATPEDCVLYKSPLIDALDLQKFLSKTCKESFAGYAITQIKKALGLNKKIFNPMSEERKTVLDFCFVLEEAASTTLADWLQRHGYKEENCGLSHITHSKGLYALFYDVTGELGYRGLITYSLANEPSICSIPKGEKVLVHVFFNMDSYSSYCKEYREYWEWVAKRNEVRYAGNMTNNKGYDAKNMMHTIRLLQVAEEILRLGALNVRRPNREYLLEIKSGKHEYEALLTMAENMMPAIEDAYFKSKLRENVDMDYAENMLIKIRKSLYN